MAKGKIVMQRVLPIFQKLIFSHFFLYCVLLLHSLAYAKTYTLSLLGEKPPCTTSWIISGTTYSCDGRVSLESGDSIISSSNATLSANNGFTIPENNTIGTATNSINLVSDYGTINITNSTLYGSIQSTSGTITLSSSTLSDNITSSGTTNLINSNFVGNISSKNGITTTNSNITGNITATNGEINLNGGTITGNIGTNGNNQPIKLSNITMPSGSIQTAGNDITITKSYLGTPSSLIQITSNNHVYVNDYSIVYANITTAHPEWGQTIFKLDTSVIYGTCIPNTGDPQPCTNIIAPPIIEYRMDECSWTGKIGEVKDSGGENYNATAKSANNSNIPQVSKQIINNGALFQRAKQQYLDIPTLKKNTPNFNDGFTVTAWAKFSSTAGSWERIFDFGNGNNKNNIFLGREYTSNNLVLGIHETPNQPQDNNKIYLVAQNAISDTNWHLWAVTCSGGSCKLYKDGQEIASKNDMYIPDNGTRAQSYIGKSNWDDAYFEGGIDEFKVFDTALNSTQIRSIYTNESAGKNYDGSARNNICNGICTTIKSLYNTTTDGYYYVNEAIATPIGLKPFEIYCEGMKTNNISQYLPTVINQSNSANSNFKFKSIENSKYYTSPNKTFFSKIPIDEKFFATNSFLSQGFSNINLIGTPFSIDLPNTALETCDSATDMSKLRIGHFNQAIKIDPTVETKNYCTASTMPFKQIPNYYAKDAYSNLTSCAQVAQISSTRPPSGYYLLHKGKATVGEGNYIVAYCEMNPPVAKQIWTIFLALDGQTTDQKSDVVNGQDTCSKVGYSFFTPNQKVVMEAARSFLFNFKSEWSDYTGSVKDYFNDYNINGWATDSQTSVYKPNPIPNGPMWPYGPFGIYKPSNGASSNKSMAISTNFLSNVDKNDSFSSLDALGWKSVLPEINAIYADQWWVADIAAGYARNASGHLVRIDASIEPNGDYDANNWLGWFANTNGYIIHYNDQNGNNKYRYSNYMCISRDMYTIIDNLWDTWGFDAWDTTKSISLRTISTKKVSENFNLTIASLNNTNTALNTFNGTVCVRIVDDKNVSYNSNGSSLYFNNEQTKTLSGINITSALKDARVLLSWKANINTTCPLASDSNKTLATDNFAIRPDNFGSTMTANQTFIADKNSSIVFRANQYGGIGATKYNESINSSFKVDVNISDSTKTCAVNSIQFSPAINFNNGISTSTLYNLPNVGDYTVSMHEIEGAEFAKVDSADTPDAQRYITPYAQTLKVIPSTFLITGTFSNGSNGFTYLSNFEQFPTAANRDISAHLDLNISARSATNALLSNYTALCYAKDANLTLRTNTTGTTLTNLSKFLWYENNHNLNGSVVLDTNTSYRIPLSAALFDSTTQGMAEMNYRINFDRNITKPVQPFRFTIQDLTTTDTDLASGAMTLNQNATFYYGRVYSTDYRGPTPTIPTTIRYEVYCKDCNRAVFTIAGIESPTSLYWFQNPLHVITDGIVFQFAKIGTTTIANPNGSTINANGFDTSHPLTNATAPYVDRILMTPSAWLLFNLFNASATTNDFNVEFIRSGNWSGAGGVDRNDTSHSTGAFTNDTNITRGNRKMNW